MTQEQRSYLAQYFSDRAGWHGGHSRQNADGEADRLEFLAHVYRALATHIGSLDDNDLRLVALARLTNFEVDAGFFPGPHLSAAIADAERFVPNDPDPFLEYLVHAALDDRLGEQEVPVAAQPIFEFGPVAGHYPADGLLDSAPTGQKAG